MTFTTDEMVSAAERELAMRKRVYPRWVEAGRMSKVAAEREIALMTAIRDRLAGEDGR